MPPYPTHVHRTCAVQLRKCEKLHPICTVLCAVGFALYCVPWFKKIKRYISVFACVSSHCVYVLLSFYWFLTSVPSYSFWICFLPCVLLYFLLPLAFPGIFSFLSLTSLSSLPPSQHAEPGWLNLSEEQCHYKHGCVPLCMCVRS